MDSLSLLPDGKKRQNELKFGSYDLCVAWIDDTVLKAHDETARFVPMVPKMQAFGSN